MKCILSSAKYEDITKKAPYLTICDYIKKGKVPEYWWGTPVEERELYETHYIEGDATFIFEKLKEISKIVKNDQFVLTFRDDGDIEAMVYDDYIE